jgi:hypothetical protein
MALHCVIQSRNCINDLKRFADKHSLTTHNLPLMWLHTVLKVHTTVTCIKMVHRTTHLTVHSSTGQHRCEICDMCLTFTSNFTSLVWHTNSFILAYSFNHYSPWKLEVYHLLIFTSMTTWHCCPVHSCGTNYCDLFIHSHITSPYLYWC